LGLSAFKSRLQQQQELETNSKYDFSSLSDATNGTMIISRQILDLDWLQII
jgi:hypothetical protein